MHALSNKATKLSEEAAQPVKHRSIDAPATPEAPEEETEDMQREEVGGDASEAETDVQKNDGAWQTAGAREKTPRNRDA